MNTLVNRPAARLFVRALVRNVLTVALLGMVVLFGMVGQDKDSVSRPAAEGVATFTQNHECGSSVQDPTHVVVTVDGVTRYAGQRMTDRAIEQAVFGIDHGLVVHEFCR